MAGRALRIEKERERTAASLEERIRERAHQIYLARGAKDGSEVDDWLRAEKELRPAATEETGQPAAGGRSSHRS
jgi:hypothetical protein